MAQIPENVLQRVTAIDKTFKTYSRLKNRVAQLRDTDYNYSQEKDTHWLIYLRSSNKTSWRFGMLHNIIY